MERIAPWLAVVLAAAIAVVAVFELDMRSDEGDVALEPTAVPSPSGPTTAAPTTMGPETPTTAPTERPEATDMPTATATIESTVTPTTAPTEAPTIEPTPEATTAPPVGADEMPNTGGGAVTGGLSVLSFAGVAAIVLRRRRQK